MSRDFILNIIDFFEFGFNLYKKGICNNRIKNSYVLLNFSENKGYTKQEASNVLGISVRQFDRRVKKGQLPKGKKHRGVTSLYWSKDIIDKYVNI